MPQFNQPSSFSVPAPFGTLSAKLHVAKNVSASHLPVVLWPSLFSTADVQVRLIEELQRARHVLAIDPPGHGRSRLDWPSNLTIASTADATLALTDVAGLDQPANLVGTSWGSLIGLSIALRAPDRLAHLGLLNTPFAFHPGGWGTTRWLPWMARFAGRTAMFSDGVARSFFLPSTVADPRNVAAMTAHRATFADGDPKGLFAAARHIFQDREDLSPHLPKVRVPTLVVAGRHDPMYDLDMQREATERLANADYLEVEAAHIAAVDAPEQMARALQDVWARSSHEHSGQREVAA